MTGRQHLCVCVFMSSVFICLSVLLRGWNIWPFGVWARMKSHKLSVLRWFDFSVHFMLFVIDKLRWCKLVQYTASKESDRLSKALYFIRFAFLVWNGLTLTLRVYLISLLPAVCCSLTMGQLYDKEKDEDGFLYVAYSGENTFGYKEFCTKHG